LHCLLRNFLEDMVRNITPILLIGSLLLAACLAFLFLAVLGFQKAKAVGDWEVVQGEIVSVGVNRIGGLGSQHYDRWKTDVEYRYQYTGKAYRNQKITYGSLPAMEEEAAWSFASKYSPGESVNVYVNPQSPSESALMVTEQSVAVLWVAVLTFFVVSSVMVIVVVLSRKGK
jgi:hypothetical protein